MALIAGLTLVSHITLVGGFSIQALLARLRK